MPRADARGGCRADARGERGALIGARARIAVVALLLLGLFTGCTPADTAAPDAVDDGIAGPDDRGTDEPDGAVADDPPAADDGAAADRRSDPEPAPAPPQFEPPPPPPSRDALIAEVGRMLTAAAAEADTGDLAVAVVDEHGREIGALRADDPMIPASTLKIVTAAAVLTTLGPRFSIRTAIETTAPVGADGTIAGDLVLVGAGDPVLGTPEYGRWVYPARPRTPLEELADRLADGGVTRIDGDVLAVAPGFSGPRVPEGWPDRYFSSFDARYSDGLTVDAGLRTIVTYPEPEDDETEGGDDEALDTAAGQGDVDADVVDLPDDAADLGPPDVRVDHAAEPALQAASELIRLLEERDVEVVGEPAQREPTGPLVGRLAVTHSPPLLELLRFAVQRSDNQLTDGLFRLAGWARTGVGSFEAGDRALRQVLDHHGIDHEVAVFADGSGLSRDDRATARLLVEVDRAMTASRHGPAWSAIMASMGETGTLERRLRGTIAQGRFLGKTGTLQDVTALTGSVVADDGARYHLAVIANDAGATRGVARALADELVLLLVADVDVCSYARPGEEDGPIGLPGLLVSC